MNRLDLANTRAFLHHKYDEVIINYAINMELTAEELNMLHNKLCRESSNVYEDYQIPLYEDEIRIIKLMEIFNNAEEYWDGELQYCRLMLCIIKEIDKYIEDFNLREEYFGR